MRKSVNKLKAIERNTNGFHGSSFVLVNTLKRIKIKEVIE
jgi:hypothetical protein